MEKLIQIIWLLSWPVIIYTTYHAVRILSARFEKKTETDKGS
jgi:hypothetical protein